MSPVMTSATVGRAPTGTNGTIEQRFAPMSAGRRPRSPNILYVDSALTTDEIGAYAGIDGTPDIDRFARSGVRLASVEPGPGAHGARIPEVLLDCGYDCGVFGLMPEADTEADVDAAARFIAARRPGPWAAYVHIATSAPERVDRAVGRLVHALRRAGHYRRTAMLLVGAACAREQFVPTMLSWPGQIPSRQRHDEPVHLADWVPTLLETAQPGLTQTLDLGGVDLSSHLFVGGPVPERSAALTRAA